MMHIDKRIVHVHGKVNHHQYDSYDLHGGQAAYVPGHGSIFDNDRLVSRVDRIDRFIKL